jgi:hypothetical protein
MLFSTLAIAMISVLVAAQSCQGCHFIMDASDDGDVIKLENGKYGL